MLPSFRGMGIRRLGLGLWLAAAASITADFTHANATTLRRQSLSDLAKGSELIFEGQVVARVVEALPDGQGARTCVTFKIMEVIAGTHPGSTIRLCFFGGMVGSRGFAVTGMRYPAVGEHGVYLVESSNEPLLNPLIGWDQGRFLVAKDSVTGTLRMTTADHRRITGLAPDAAKTTAQDGDVVSPASATAAGVISDDQPGLAGALSRDAFVKELRSLHDR
jgi:hypothetical protein